MKMRKIATTLLATAALTMLLPAATANADPVGTAATTVSTALDAAGVGAPSPFYISLASVSDGIKVCGVGTALIAGPWTLHIAGSRSSLNPTDVPISYDYLNPGSTSATPCYTVVKFGTLEGEFVVTWEYLGGTNGSDIVRPASVQGVASWVTGQQDKWVVTTGG